MKKERNPSEIIQEFIDLLQRSHDEYQKSKSMVDLYNKKTYTWTHDLEDAKCKQDRNKLATAWHKELIERRRERDNMDLWRSIHEFSSSEQNKPTLNRLKRLINVQKEAESHLSVNPEDRKFKGRC